MKYKTRRRKTPNFSCLEPWLERSRPLPPFKYFQESSPDFELGGYLGLALCVPLHEVMDVEAQSLESSWNLTNNYVKKALVLISADEGSWLDRDEVEMIKENLGGPPKACCPLYIITIKYAEDERIVYIGKTSSRISRFSGGHIVAMKLHNPTYDRYEKRVYFGHIMLLDKNKEYLPLEWVHPIEFSLSILDSVESKLIYNFQPKFNIKKKNKDYSRYNFLLHIQNFSVESSFLDDYFIYDKEK